MKLPIQARPVYRNVNNGKNSQVGIIPSDDCGDCALAKARCLTAPGIGGVAVCLAATDFLSSCLNCPVPGPRDPK